MTDGKNYQIMNMVATGGTAVLYRAIQTSLDRVVAVKKLHQHLTQDENFTRRFVLEAKAAASLDHDNIVKIIDFGGDGEAYHMVMEFIEGESLREVLDRWKQIPLDVALAVAYEVSQGLEHAHAKGIVHRDIKPGNVMLTRAGRIKITDFGLAKLTQTVTQHTAANSILGTPLYMSPEQAYGESVDHRSDLFSLGTMLYEMITGIQPFRDENYMGVIQNIIKRNAPHPSKFNVEIPSPVQSLLSKAMNKSREARFQNAGDFKKAIEKYLGLAQLKDASENLRHLLDTDGATTLLPRTIKSQQRKSRLRRGFMVALVATALFGAAGLGYTLAPDMFHERIEGVVSWVDDNMPAGNNDPPGNVIQGDLSGPYLGATFPDTSGINGAAAADTTVGTQSDPGANEVKTPPQTTQSAVAVDTTTRGDAGVPASGSRTTKAATKTAESTVSKSPVKVVRKGWLSVKVDPWAEIYVDGKYRGDAPPAAKIELTRGTHTLECRNPKYKSYHENITITAGEQSSRNIFLQKLLGSISLTTTPGAEVLVDGIRVGVSPLKEPIELGAGTHQVTVKKVGYNVWNNQIEVRADEVIPLNITLSPIY